MFPLIASVVFWNFQYLWPNHIKFRFHPRLDSFINYTHIWPVPKCSIEGRHRAQTLLKEFINQKLPIESISTFRLSLFLYELSSTGCTWCLVAVKVSNTIIDIAWILFCSVVDAWCCYKITAVSYNKCRARPIDEKQNGADFVWFSIRMLIASSIHVKDEVYSCPSTNWVFLVQHILPLIVRERTTHLEDFKIESKYFDQTQHFIFAIQDCWPININCTQFFITFHINLSFFCHLHFYRRKGGESRKLKQQIDRDNRDWLWVADFEGKKNEKFTLNLS